MRYKSLNYLPFALQIFDWIVLKGARKERSRDIAVDDF